MRRKITKYHRNKKNEAALSHFLKHLPNSEHSISENTKGLFNLIWHKNRYNHSVASHSDNYCVTVSTVKLIGRKAAILL